MVATTPIDFRKGEGRLAPMVKNELRKDPFTGTIFGFSARKADRLKRLCWGGTGLAMACNQLAEHRFTWPAVQELRARSRCPAGDSVGRIVSALDSGHYGALGGAADETASDG